MIEGFISLRFLDILDILLVAFLMYQIFLVIKGSVAINIFVVIFSVYLFWQLVEALEMDLLSTILGQFMGVGLIALIIVFQQELRRFLLMIGTRDFFSRSFSVEQIFYKNRKSLSDKEVDEIVKSCVNMSATRTGALIVLTTRAEPGPVIESGDVINSKVSGRLIESIFFKNSPLHDGAIVIFNRKIVAARCVLPLSKTTDLPAHMGLRHRAAKGMTENYHSLVLTVSEETGSISIFEPASHQYNINSQVLRSKLENWYGINEQKKEEASQTGNPLFNVFRKF
ncbi:MAG TPA: diadenylate cyclase [Salinivirga sp.]|uniref:diadenylate cyclase n=1 Tax=Salinivirga sp. TaxID=1970192 RepID=UPI002B498D99|nr:diadenylate cyclase [Salinivirga sp.]HKK59572.1 diadenylate cyclase [Salinivirga sp.]